jgi:hypothetical protein
MKIFLPVRMTTTPAMKIYLDLPHAAPEWFSPYLGLARVRSPAPVRLMWTSSFTTMHLPRAQVCHTGHPLRTVDPGGAVQGWSDPFEDGKSVMLLTSLSL